MERDGGSPRAARVLGLVACAVGAVLLLAYPTHQPWMSAHAVGGGEVPRPTDSSWRFVASVLLGPIALAWGASATYDRSLRPLTPKRAALVPVAGAASLAVGVARFAYPWYRETPLRFVTDTGPGDVWDPGLIEIVGMELHGLGILLVAGTTALVVGTIAAIHGRRRAAVATTIPVTIVGLEFAWTYLVLGPQLNSALALLGIAAAFAFPAFGVGYVTAKRRPYPR